MCPKDTYLESFNDADYQTNNEPLGLLTFLQKDNVYPAKLSNNESHSFDSTKWSPVQKFKRLRNFIDKSKVDSLSEITNLTPAGTNRK